MSALASRKMSKIPHGPQLLIESQHSPHLHSPPPLKGAQAHRPLARVSLFKLLSSAPLGKKTEVRRNEPSVPTVLAGS